MQLPGLFCILSGCLDWLSFREVGQSGQEVGHLSLGI